MSNYRQYKSHPPLKNTPANRAYHESVLAYNAKAKEHNDRVVHEIKMRNLAAEAAANPTRTYSPPGRANAAIGWRS